MVIPQNAVLQPPISYSTTTVSPRLISTSTEIHQQQQIPVPILLDTLVAFLISQTSGSALEHRKFAKFDKRFIEDPPKPGLLIDSPQILKAIKSPDPHAIYPWMVWVPQEEVQKSVLSRASNIINLAPREEINQLITKIKTDPKLRDWLQKKTKAIENGNPKPLIDSSPADVEKEPSTIKQLLLAIHNSRKNSISDADYQKTIDDLNSLKLTTDSDGLVNPKIGSTDFDVIDPSEVKSNLNIKLPTDFKKLYPFIQEKGSPMLEGDLAKLNENQNYDNYGDRNSQETLKQKITDMIGPDQSYLLKNSALGPQVILGSRINALMNKNVMPSAAINRNLLIPSPLAKLLSQQYLLRRLHSNSGVEDARTQYNLIEGPPPAPITDVNSLSIGRDYVPYAFG